jgi:hypothetical protein
MDKTIKQHLRIKKFLGNSENAVKTQMLSHPCQRHCAKPG